MMNLSARGDLPELMDAADLPVSDYERCLKDLSAVNRLTLTHRCTLQFLKTATQAMPPGTKILVLDIGFGHGDLLRAINRFGTKRGFDLALTGVDLNPRSAITARDATPPDLKIDYRVADVFNFQPEKAPDFIVTSQFTHHLTDDEIVRLLQWMDANAVKGWHIADLHRHILAYYGFGLLCRVMGWHRIVRYDGTISIARSFRRTDWVRYLACAGLQAKVSWHPLFRYSVSRRK